MIPSLEDVPIVSNFHEVRPDAFIPFGLIYVKVPLGILSLYHGEYKFPAATQFVLPDSHISQRVTWTSISRILNRNIEGDLEFAENFRTFSHWSFQLERNLLSPWEQIHQRIFGVRKLHRTFYKRTLQSTPHIHKNLFTIIFSTVPETVVWAPKSKKPKLLTPPPGHVIVMLGAQGRFLGEPVLHCTSIPSEGCTSLTFSTGSWLSNSMIHAHNFAMQRRTTISLP